MANNNVQNVRFLRNGSLYGDRSAALNGLNGQTLAAEQDGSLILARYGSGNEVKTLVGVVYVNGSNKSLTIFDIDGASASVEALRTEINNKLGTGVTSANTATAQLEALSGTSSSSSGDTSVWGAKKYADQKISDAINSLDYSDSAVAGEYVSQVTEADGVIAVTRVTLPDASSVSGDSKVVIDVTQDKGAITATAANLTGVKLDGYSVGNDDSDKVASSDTLGEALGKLQGQINGMDKTASAEDGKVVTTISETDGVVSETKTNVKDLQLGGYSKDTAATGNIASGDTINAALSKLENKAAAITIANADGSINVTTAATGTGIDVNIKSGEHVLAKNGNAGLYTNITINAVTGTELSDLGTNVAEAYKLVGTDGTKLGEFIKIYKDSSLVNLYLGHVDDLLSGTTAQTEESESSVVVQGSGSEALVWIVQLDDGNYKLAAVDVESFLQESEFASGVTADSATHIVHGVVDTTSETFLTVGADGFKLSGVQNAIDSAINALDVTGDTAVAGQYVAAIEQADGVVAVKARANVSEAVLTNYAKGSDSGAVASTDTINAAISKLENQIDSKVDALDATVSGETSDGKVNVKVTETNGVITAVDVVGTDIASASALTAEIAARKAVDGQTGQTYAANTSSPYISGATDLNDADVKLAAALKSLSDDTVNQVKVNSIALTETDNAVNVQISAAARTGASSTPITVDTDSSTGAIKLKLEGIDCGTY